MELKNKKRDFRRTISALLVAALVFTCFGGNLQGVVVKANGVSGQTTGGNVECDHIDTETINVVEADCKTPGYTGDLWCNDCEKIISEGVETDVDATKHNNTRKINEATGNCGEAGYTGDTWCDDCEKIIANGEPIPPSNNHTGGEATCKDKAVCGVCREPYGEVNANNHKNTEVRGKETPTCGKAGYTGDTWCKDCNTKIATGTTDAATGRHSVKTQITKADATKKTNGSSKSVCSVCKKIIKTNATYYYPKSVTVSTVTYNGKSQTPKVVVKDSKGKTISSSHYTVSKVKKVGKSTITITFKSSSAYYTGKLTAKCTVNPTATKFTKVTAGKKKITLKWSKKTSEVSGYYIEYSTDKKFKKGVKTVKITKNKTTSKTISKLKAKKKYYVRIRTYKGSYKSSWSSVKSVTTKK